MTDALIEGPSLVTGTRNQRYEQSQRALGLRKVTLWLPETHVAEFAIAAFDVRLRREYHLAMLRSRVTGKLKKLE